MAKQKQQQQKQVTLMSSLIVALQELANYSNILRHNKQITLSLGQIVT